MLTLQQVKDKSTKKLIGMHPRLVSDALKMIEEAYKMKIMIAITDGYRSIDEQNKLYAQGRTKPGKIVTNAKGGTSYHNYGLAFDFCLIAPDGKTYVWNVNQDWIAVVAIGKSLGLEWGGEFKTIYDPPHFQRTFGLSIGDLQKGRKPVIMDKEAGKEIIKIMQALYAMAKTKEEKNSYHRLANEVRLAIGEVPY